MILHLILTSVLKELWCDKSFFLCLNKKLSLHFLNKVCMFAATNNKNLRSVNFLSTNTTVP